MREESTAPLALCRRRHDQLRASCEGHAACHAALGLGGSLQISLERNRIDVAPSVPHAHTGLLPSNVAGVEHPNCISTFALISACSGEGPVIESQRILKATLDNAG